MNIFFFDQDPVVCAQAHCDRHVTKMIVEYAQILSTAHRLLDGEESVQKSKTGRKQKVWTLPDSRDETLYKATHVNHPSCKWTRVSDANYRWLYSTFLALLAEYKYRYGRDHACTRLISPLNSSPNSIPGGDFTPPWRAMPDQYKVDKSDPQYCQKSYRDYFNTEKQHIARWKDRPVPSWFKANT